MSCTLFHPGMRKEDKIVRDHTLQLCDEKGERMEVGYTGQYCQPKKHQVLVLG
jgi:hypothetical protein